MQSRIPQLAAVFLFCLALPAPCLAQASSSPRGQVYGRDDWTVTVGVGTLIGTRHRYLGSDRVQVLPLPFVEVRWRDRLFLSPVEGLGANLLARRSWRAGLAVHGDFGRQEADGPRLAGLGDIAPVPEARLFLQGRLGRVTVDLMAHRRLGQGRGALLDLSLGYPMVARRRLTLSLGPTATWADAAYTRLYFGVSGAQSAVSGLPEYRTGSGIRDLGLKAGAVAPLGGRWALVGIARGARLMSTAGDSPVVEQRFAGQVGTFVAYRF